ncbi:RNA polymerase sigma-70 factor [Fredinandcohnia sp. 179-A 10B2 NHS]|uniref:RNA polymerase sigma-70 factor n=1 Tax=Fredinandcohnia sp. 179-A 10B2 NHS TaxID=3235176 RepID=UPI00399F70F6
MLDESLYLQYKPLLFSIAYRMTGTITEAEDILHDVLLGMEKADFQTVSNPKAYLCKMVTNKSLDYMKSAKKKRELYSGPWLPEPVVTHGKNDPILKVLQKDQVSYALQTLMEQLSPIERAVFVLRQVFEFDYQEIASMVNKEETNCRKIFSRANKKLDYKVVENRSGNERLQQLVHQFVIAASTGQMEHLLSLLSEDAVLYSDGGGKVKAALVPIQSKDRVAAFIFGLVKKFGNDSEYTVEPIRVEGQVGLLLMVAGEIESVICFDQKDNYIHTIYMVRNPEKLQHISLYYKLDSK